MNPGQNSSAASIVALALAFHRAPTQHASLLHGRAPLPAGVSTLLKLAGGSEPGPAYAMLGTADELKAAALFFIEQVLFRQDGSHYRVLGVGQAASLNQIKEHHRLLMRVFHPDRENRADDWKGAFATRINLAYAHLRDPDARRRYDATLKPAGRPGASPRSNRRAITPRTATPLRRATGLPPLLLRYLPQWVLAGTALIAVAFVGMVYLDNLPAPALHTQNLALQVAPTREAQPAIGVAEPSATIADLQEPGKPQPPAFLPPQVATRLAVPEKPELTATRDATAIAVSPPPLPTQPAVNVVIATATAPMPSRLPPSKPDAAPLPRPAVSTPPMESAPDATLAQFMSAYERGDTQALMAFFDDAALAKAGGKLEVRRQHESLFRSTDLRHIAIDSVTWSWVKGGVRGEGRYRKTLMPKGELRLQTENGIFHIELSRHGEQTLITGLDYLPGERS